MMDSSSLPSLSPLSPLGRLDLPPASPPVGRSFPPRLPGAAPRPAVAPGPPHLSGCVPLSHQVAGHKYGVDKVGILQHPDGTVLKQLQPPPRGPREMQFYRMVYAEDCCDPCLLDLQKHLPKYYGTWSSPENPHDLYLKLEDVTRRFVKPCIMDVKLGQRSYDPFASQEKREQQIRKYPLMEEVGFLVLGMRVYKVGSDTFDTYDQHYGRGLVKDTIKDGLAQFFHNGVVLRRDAVWASVQRVQQILTWFQSQRQLAFYASSLLFVYEGLPPSIFSSSFSSLLCSPRPTKTSEEVKGGAVGEKKEKEEEEKEYNNNSISLSSVYSCYRKDAAVSEEDNKSWSRTGEQTPNGNKTQLGGKEEQEEERKSQSRRKEEEQEEGPEGEGSAVEVRMIDFAHVFPSESLDEGYIYGLKRLLLLLQQILCDSN